MQKLEGQIEEVNGWIDGAEKKMDELESHGPNDAVLKVVVLIDNVTGSIHKRLCY